MAFKWHAVALRVRTYAQNWLIFKFTKMNNIYNQIRALWYPSSFVLRWYVHIVHTSKIFVCDVKGTEIEAQGKLHRKKKKKKHEPKKERMFWNEWHAYLFIGACVSLLFLRIFFFVLCVAVVVVGPWLWVRAVPWTWAYFVKKSILYGENLLISMPSINWMRAGIHSV